MRNCLIAILLTTLSLHTLNAASTKTYYERLQAQIQDSYGELTQGEVLLREKDKPGAGLMIYFSSKTSAASLYIYDRQITPIPEGADSAELRREFNYNLGQYQLRATGKDAIEEPVPTSNPLFENLVIEASGQKMPLNDQMTRYARLKYEQDGTTYIEHLFMTGHNSHFWLITYAYPEELAMTGEQEMAGFIEALPGLIR